VSGAPSAEAPGPRARRRTGGSAGGLGLLDGGDPTARQFLVNDALVAWGGMLTGEIEGYGLEHWLPSIVGPLRDVQVRDALVGWLCPGSVALDTFPTELVVMLEVFLGPGLRLPTEVAGEPDPEGEAGPRGMGDDNPQEADVDAVRSRRRSSNEEELHALRELLDLPSLFGGEPEEGAEEEAQGGEEQRGDEQAWDDWEEAAVPRLLLSRLEQACRLTPAAHAAPLLAVVASLAWWSGDGARAGVAVDRALQIEPEHRLSRLVRRTLDHGIRPPRCA
jgi:hypothetical protein